MDVFMFYIWLAAIQFVREGKPIRWGRRIFKFLFPSFPYLSFALIVAAVTFNQITGP